MKVHRLSILAALVVTLACGSSGARAEESKKSSVVAQIQGEQITLEELTAAAAGELIEVEQQRHQILVKHLDQMLADRVIALETKSRQLDKATLMKEAVDTRLADPTEAEIDQVYEANKARLRGTKEESVPQIRQFLMQQQRQRYYSEWVSDLKEKYGVTTLLEPFRVTVESAGHPALGREEAPVTIVELSDFECPYCSRFTNTVKKVQAEFSDSVRLVFRQFPLTSLHPNAMKAAEASLCAGEQGKFWELHDAMFEDQRKLAPADLQEKADRVGLDLDSFEQCLSSGKFRNQVQVDLNEGRQLGITGTPAVFVNGRPFRGAVSYEQLAQVVREEIEREGS